MNQAIQTMLAKYKCNDLYQYENALKEIIQEITLLGLWRAKFFEKAAFYGGSALRILYGQHRFSEDLDFSLLKKDASFSLRSFEKDIVNELRAYEFEVDISSKQKDINRKVESAFIKANTLIHLIKINVHLKTHKDANLKVKLEIDTDPPSFFSVESKQHFQPIPFSIKSYTLPCLFAGKLHALLCRERIKNIKGRDWYDFLWYISRDVPVDLTHLKERMVQSGHWRKDESFTLTKLKQLVIQKVNTVDLNLAKEDVINFIENPSDLDAWSQELFISAAERLKG